MANFNYLDFFKTPGDNDAKLFIKDINNNVVWTLSPFKIQSSIIQNNNIRINFKNGDFVLIDFNNVYESKYALTTLQTAIQTLINKEPIDIDKDVKTYIDNKFPYKLYTALLTQSGTASPTASVLYNTLGNMTFSYYSTGRFKCVSDSLFKTGKTFIILGNATNTTYTNNNDNFAGVIEITDQSNFYIRDIRTFANGKMYNTPIEIRVYN